MNGRTPALAVSPVPGEGVGSAKALAQVFDAHAAYVGRSLRCLGVREHELGDVIQEVFLVVHGRLAELSDASRLRAWLYAICVKKALSARRDAARRASREVKDESRVAAASGVSDPLEELEKTQKLAQALAILGELDDDKRVIFVLHEVEQLAMSEVAEIVGCPLQTAYSRLYAAKKEIAATLRRLRARGTLE